MRRWHMEESRTKREWRKHRNQHVDSNIGRSTGEGPGQVAPGTDPQKVDCSCDEQKGRFRKKHAYGCGKVRCGICKSHKYPKREPTLDEIQSELQFKERMKEFRDGDE